jgi:predicted Zn-dependent protease
MKRKTSLARLIVVVPVAACILALPGGIAGCAAPPKHAPAEQQARGRPEQTRARVKYQLAERSFKTGQIDESMTLCREVLALDPGSIEGHLLTARIQLEKGRTAEAEAALHGAAGLGESVPELDYLRGLLCERREQRAEAVSWYRRAYDARPIDAEYLVACVESMLSADQVAEACDLLQKRHRDFDRDIRIQLLCAQTLAMTGRNREAADAYLSVLRLAPADPSVREEVGTALLAVRRINEAQAVLEPLLESGDAPPSAGLLETWSAALLDAGSPQRAIAVLERTAPRYAGSPRLLVLLAQAWLMADKPASARDAARQACLASQDSREARLLLAYACLGCNDREGAVAAAREIIASHPDDTDAIAILERVANPAQGGLARTPRPDAPR